MKKMLLTIVLLFCTGLMVQNVLSKDICSSDDPLYIPIPPMRDPIPTTTGTPKPLSLVQDIEAVYCGGVLTIESNIDAGVAEIVVTNVYTGEQWYDSINGYGSVSLFIYDAPGDYEIIVTNDKCTYRGMFVL